MNDNVTKDDSFQWSSFKNFFQDIDVDDNLELPTLFLTRSHDESTVETAASNNDDNNDDTQEKADKARSNLQHNQALVRKGSTFYWAHPMNWSEWRDERINFLRAFVKYRIADDEPAAETDSFTEEQEQRLNSLAAYERVIAADAGSASCSDDGSGDGCLATQRPDSLPVEYSNESTSQQSTELETQIEMPLANQLNKNDSSLFHSSHATASSSFSNVAIPHIDDTLHQVDYLADADLWTKRLNLRFCNVVKFWKSRHTKRRPIKIACSRPHPVFLSSFAPMSKQIFPRLARNFCDEDGPLSVCYRHVLPIEILQVHTAIPELRRRAEHTQDTVVKTYRIKLFLYNEYATHIESILKNRPSRNDADYSESIFLQLENVPAKSILPYAPSDWYDRHDLKDICLCIGAQSLLKFEEKSKITNGKNYDQVYLRFDDPELRIRIGWIKQSTERKNGNVMSEWELRPAIGYDDKVLVEHVTGSAGILEQEYLAWKRQQNDLSGRSMREEARLESTLLTETDLLHKPRGESSNKLNDAILLDSFNLQIDPKKPHDTPIAPIVNAMGDKEIRTEKQQNRAHTIQIHQTGVCLPEESQSDSTPLVEPIMNKQSSPNSKDKYDDLLNCCHVQTATQPPAPATINNNVLTPPVDVVTLNSHVLPNSSFVYDKESLTTNKVFETPQKRRLINSNSTPSSTQQKRQREMIAYTVLNDLRGLYATHKSISLQLNDNAMGTCLVNIFGVVLGFRCASRTSRGDWMMSLTLVDESLPLPEQESLNKSVYIININIFTKDKNDLPDIRFAGDVIRLHRVKVQEWKEEVQLVGLHQSSYLVFRGNPDCLDKVEDSTLSPTAKNEFTLTDEDKKRFLEIWKWSRQRVLVYPTMKVDQSFTLSDMRRWSTQDNEMIKNVDKFDLTAMVAAIVPIHSNINNTGVLPRGYLRVWDGTGYPESDPPLNTSPRYVIENGDPPNEALVKIAVVVEQLNHAIKIELQPPKSLTGRVVNVVVWEQSHWDLVNTVVFIGSFIRLRNVSDNSLFSTGPRCLMIASKSSLTPLPDLIYEVATLLQNHNDRLVRNDPFNPNSGILPLDANEVANDLETYSLTSKTPLSTIRNMPSPSLELEISFQQLMDRAPPTIYHGNVYIRGLIPNIKTIMLTGLSQIISVAENKDIKYRFAVQLLEVSTRIELAAIVADNGTAGDVLVGMSAAEATHDPCQALLNMRSFLKLSSRQWQAHIKSVCFQGALYFLLVSLKAVE